MRTQHVGQWPLLSAKSLHNDVQNQDQVVGHEKEATGREKAERNAETSRKSDPNYSI